MERRAFIDLKQLHTVIYSTIYWQFLISAQFIVYCNFCSDVDLDPDPYLDPDWIRIQWGPWIRIQIRNPDPDPGGKNGPENRKS
jgi:hypothetical protein